MKFKIVEVEWFDAQSGIGSSIEVDEADDLEPVLTHSVGYLLRKDKEVVVLGFMLFDYNQTFKHWQMIPRDMVRKIRILK